MTLLHKDKSTFLHSFFILTRSTKTFPHHSLTTYQFIAENVNLDSFKWKITTKLSAIEYAFVIG